MLLTSCFCLLDPWPCSSFGLLAFVSPCVYNGLVSYKVKKAGVEGYRFDHLLQGMPIN